MSHGKKRHIKQETAKPVHAKAKPAKQKRKPEKPGESWQERFFKGRRVAVIVVILLAIFAAQAITSMAVKSPTSDEVADLPSGYTHLMLHDYRLFPEHPPLVKTLAALPLLPTGPDMKTDDVLWKTASDSRKNWNYGILFSFDWNGGVTDEMFFRGRLVIVLLGICLGLLVFFWTRSIFGNAAGVFALFLYSFSPNIIAHSRLITTDLGVSLFALLALWCFDRALRRITPVRVLLAGITLGLAFLAKYNALVLLPVFAIILLVRALDNKRVRGKIAREFSLRTRGIRLLVMPVVLLVILGVTAGTIWAGYGFRFYAFSEPGLEYTGRFTDPVKSGLHQSLYEFGLDNKLLPQAFLRGFHYNVHNSEREDALCTLDGKTRTKPWPSYYVMTFLYKTPVPMLIFFVAALVLALKLGADKWRGLLPLIVFAFIYYATALSTNVNLGHRLVLPVIPVIFIFTGSVINRIRGAGRGGLVLLTVFFLGLAGWYVAEAALIYPDYIAYFNQIAGGPDNGYKHLVDSNIDWGQDVKRIEKNFVDHGIAFTDEHGNKRVHLALFTNATPEYFKFDHEWIQTGVIMRDIQKWPVPIEKGDYLAVSVNVWTDSLTSPELPPSAPTVRFGQFRSEENFEPIGNVGHSILIFRAKKRIDLTQHWNPDWDRPSRRAGIRDGD
ncbi:MAG: glycosyltransferase family 39 protein [Planctomycetota bacterium]